MKKAAMVTGLMLLLACSAENPGVGDGGNASPGGGGGAGGAGGSAGSAGSGGVGGASGGSGGASGGGHSSDIPEYISGTRIKARLLTTPDGAQEYLGWQDTMLNIPCGFAPAPDGTLRCLPSFSRMAQVIDYFSDSKCGVKLALLTNPGCTPTYWYASGPTVPVCDVNWGANTYRIYQVAGQYTGTIYSGTPANCTMVQTLPAGWTFWNQGAEVDYSMFATGTVTVK